MESMFCHSASRFIKDSPKTNRGEFVSHRCDGFGGPKYAAHAPVELFESRITQARRIGSQYDLRVLDRSLRLDPSNLTSKAEAARTLCGLL